MPTTDTKLQQLVINVGTTEQIEAAIAGGTITEDMLSITTNGPYYIQGVKVNGVDLTPDSNSKVNIDLSNYVTLDTEQTIINKKIVRYSETIPAANVGGQESTLKLLSSHTNSDMDNRSMWCGRLTVGNKEKTFIMGVCNNYVESSVNNPLCALGAHSWTDSYTDTGAAWEDLYINPDGNKTVYIGGYKMKPNTGWLRIQNAGADSGGKVQVNTGTISSPTWTDVTGGGGGGGGAVDSVNGQTGDVVLTASDVGALPDTFSDYVTLSTSQKMQAAKAIFGTDVAFGSDSTQKNLLSVISNSNSTAGNWIGRLTVGAKNKTFIMGTYGSICVLGAHSWTNAQQGTGAAWEPVYINPDGDKAVYIGGSPINGKQAMMVIQNVNANTTGTVKINRSSNLSNNFKDVACWDDDVRKFSFTSISGYNSSSNQMLTHDTNGTLKWVDI